jgi:hypothetical protein
VKFEFDQEKRKMKEKKSLGTKFEVSSGNRTAHIRHQCRKTIVLSCHRCLINSGVEKNEQHLNID